MSWWYTTYVSDTHARLRGNIKASTSDVAVMYGCHNNYSITGNNSIIAIQRKGSAMNSSAVPTKTTRFHNEQQKSTFIGVVLSFFRPGVIIHITELFTFTFTYPTHLPILRLVYISFYQTQADDNYCRRLIIYIITIYMYLYVFIHVHLCLYLCLRVSNVCVQLYLCICMYVCIFIYLVVSEWNV